MWGSGWSRAGLLAIVMTLALALPAGAQADPFTGFDNDPRAGDWRVCANGEPPEAEDCGFAAVKAEGGNPGAYIEATDAGADPADSTDCQELALPPEQCQFLQFISPLHIDWAHNVADHYGGTFKFDLRASGTPTRGPIPVIVSTDNGSLETPDFMTTPAANTWTSYSVTLDENSGLVYCDENFTCGEATQTDVLRVLADFRYVDIIADTSGGTGETVGLDNVGFSGGALPADLDDDSDTVPDVADNCPAAANPGQEDLDADGLGDACDADQDGDGVANEADDCPTGEVGWTSDAQTDNDGDGCRDADEDADDDNDTVNDGADNCSTVPNTDQNNTDGDAQGNACDPDDDNDTVNDEPDNCPLTSNTDQQNTDGDEEGDECDADDDNDGKADDVDGCPLVAADTPDGCPVIDRTLTLRYVKAKTLFKGRLSSPQPDCAVGKTVTVFRRAKGPDKKIGQAPTNEVGAYKIDKSRVRRGKYYSKVPATTVEGTQCAAATSPAVRVGG